MIGTSAISIFCLLAASHTADAVGVGANPIRKVVSMLQAMQKKITNDGVAAEKLHNEYACWCSNGAGALTASISAAKQSLPQLESAIKGKSAKKSELEMTLKQDQVGRDAAKQTIAKATAIRAKEAGAFAAASSNDKSLIAAVNGAIAALEKGAAGGFLQSGMSQAILKRANSMTDMSDMDREDLTAFLAGKQGSSSATPSGQIIGILKQMGESMGKALAESTAAENAAAAESADLVAAKTKEVEALSAGIETKLQRIADLGVELAQLPNDVADTLESMTKDEQFLADMGTSCKTKAAEFQEEKKTRSEELVALADTIKVLNDDDALELFKKTLPGSSASFLQMRGKSAMRAQALSMLRSAEKDSGRHSQLELITLALRGKKAGFDKVSSMIDELMDTLKTDQADDDHKKEYCEGAFDKSDDKKKAFERAVGNAKDSIETAKDGIAAVTEEIAALEAKIKATDARVAEMTKQRKEEETAFAELVSSDSAAKELLGFAKNRLNKFYNPKLYVAPAPRKLSEEDRIVVSMGGTAPPTAPPGGIAGTGISFVQLSSRVPPPPEAAEAYGKSGQSTGVIALIDLLIKDLDKELTEAKTAESEAQTGYEQAMSDAASERSVAVKTLTDKSAAKASVEGDLQTRQGELASSNSQLSAAEEFIMSLHQECDWLLKYHAVRTEARNGEVESLKTAKAVLAGADFESLLQIRSGFLARKH